jgi:hypothetical protein
MKEAATSDYLIRLIDQTGRKGKYLYASITKEQLNEITKILEISEEDWD